VPSRTDAHEPQFGEADRQRGLYFQLSSACSAASCLRRFGSPAA